MIDGTSQGLYIIVAVVIFGIFVAISYLIFQGQLKPKLTSILNLGTDQSLLLTTQYDTDKSAVFPDLHLQKALRDNLKLSKESLLTGYSVKDLKILTANVLESHNQELTNSFKYYKTDLQIESLKGLENAKNLEQLALHGNKVKYIEALQNLPKLKSINLNYNNSTYDISVFTKIPELHTLYIERNKYENLEKINDIEKLKELNLSDSNIKNLDFLKDNETIEVLYIIYNSFDDIDSIKTMKNLKTVYLTGSTVSKDIDFPEHLTVYWGG